MWTSSSSSSSWSLSSSSSPSLYNTARPPPDGKIMEEVWGDISLTSDLPHHHHSSIAPGMTLQEFFPTDPATPITASSSSPPPAPPAPPTMPNMNSATHHFQNQQQNVSSLNFPFDASRKRFLEFQTTSGDRRHKRMIKNRESAVRSRARKKAYTKELELEVAHLLEENAKLKEHHDQLFRSASAQDQKMKPLHRTFTAPF
ncbi:hypothetical protein OROGR_008117 [Orobanche gracilis]